MNVPGIIILKIKKVQKIIVLEDFGFTRWWLKNMKKGPFSTIFSDFREHEDNFFLITSGYCPSEVLV